LGVLVDGAAGTAQFFVDRVRAGPAVDLSRTLLAARGVRIAVCLRGVGQSVEVCTDPWWPQVPA